jgi:hypothetical protein
MDENEEVYEDEEEEEELTAAELAEQELRDLYRELKKHPKTSQEYMVISQRITDATESQRNLAEANRNEVQAIEIKNQRFVPYAQIAGQVLGAGVGAAVGQMLNRHTVNDVLDCERDGYIPKSKAVGFIQKPRS